MVANDKPTGTLRYEEKPVYTTSNGCPVNGSYNFSKLPIHTMSDMVELFESKFSFCVFQNGIIVQSVALKK